MELHGDAGTVDPSAIDTGFDAGFDSGSSN